MLFTLMMNRLLNYSLKKIVFILVLLTVYACHTKEEIDFSERTKIALRDAGNTLLLSIKDSTSLIFPVKELDSKHYQLTFSQPLYFEPGALVNSIEESFKTMRIVENYRVEVLQCRDGEVAYSYQMSAEEEQTIFPCAGRYLPEACYSIQIKFINRAVGIELRNSIPYIISLIIFSGMVFLIYRKLKRVNIKANAQAKTRIGSFYFYPDQNKLVKEAEEIPLSKKECELLALFVANPNQIIKRDELTKRVWEDNGVFVGRSLDTYISKLRKKLKADSSIKLTNVHGVGYKLEVN